MTSQFDRPRMMVFQGGLRSFEACVTIWKPFSTGETNYDLYTFTQLQTILVILIIRIPCPEKYKPKTFQLLIFKTIYSETEKQMLHTLHKVCKDIR